jgi:hypothetical protein
MTYLDPPAAAARRQNVLDLFAEELVGYGCPPEYAPHRARTLLDLALAHGYALPVVLEGPAPRGTGSTDLGRARARVIAIRTRAGCRCEPDDDRALPAAEHPHPCPVRVAWDADTQHGHDRHQPAAPGPAGGPATDGPENPPTSRDGTCTCGLDHLDYRGPASSHRYDCPAWGPA